MLSKNYSKVTQKCSEIAKNICEFKLSDWIRRTIEVTFLRGQLMWTIKIEHSMNFGETTYPHGEYPVIIKFLIDNMQNCGLEGFLRFRAHPCLVFFFRCYSITLAVREVDKKPNLIIISNNKQSSKVIWINNMIYFPLWVFVFEHEQILVSGIE